MKMKEVVCRIDLCNGDNNQKKVETDMNGNKGFNNESKGINKKLKR